MTPAPLLVVGVGNPSRGDDALGPLFVERIGDALAAEVRAGELELLTDFQLQIEHALDLVGRRRVVFVDASTSTEGSFACERVRAARHATHSTHAMSPEAVLETHQRVVGEPPESWALAIRGERFELGEPLSARARSGLEAALDFFTDWVRGRGRRLEIRGAVQGVGLRPFVAREARALGLRGRVYNTSAGVVIEAYGPGAALDALVQALRKRAPAAARIEGLRSAELPWDESAAAFTIDASVPDGGLGLPLPADLSVCAPCLADVDDPGDRHHGYAFTSCPDCGPRFSLVTELPYDRARTTLAGFAPCAACAAEHADPADRRYHAQTLACPRCGPRLWLSDGSGAERAGDALGEAARLLLEGKVVAVRGLGAFHLACDATSAEAVRTLRQRKRRDAKPFAVMVADLEMAARLAQLDDAARAALTQPARPIVLVARRGQGLAEEVSGGSLRVGLMLPYTPLHHLLLARVGRPLVMTSGNLADEPVVIDNPEALRVLGGVADALLLHDRPIARRVEDSVVQVHEGAAQVVRRARGYAPRPIRLPAASPQPVLAVGGQRKGTACVVVEDRAYVSPHLGDLDTVESEQAWQREVEGLERLLRVRAAVIAHDLHPRYSATRYALGRSAQLHHGVQHHAAHVLAAVAELHLAEPVLGVALDGTGWGPDGTAWGGELLLVDGPRWQRLASWRPLALAGGEVAIGEVWRQALALLVDACGEEAAVLAPRFACFRDVPAPARAAVERMIAAGVHAVKARGAGRYFDAVGALVLGLARAGYEGHVPLALEEAVGEAEAEPYPFTAPAQLAHGEEVGAAQELDLRPTTRALVQDALSGAAPGLMAARFHETVSAATAEVVERALVETGAAQVVLTGGVFQNRRLQAGVLRRLGRERARLARELPVNDGGLALGQAWSAVLALRQGAEA